MTEPDLRIMTGTRDSLIRRLWLNLRDLGEHMSESDAEIFALIAKHKAIQSIIQQPENNVSRDNFQETRR